MASRPRSAAPAGVLTRTAPVIGVCLSLGLLAGTPLAHAAVPPARAAAPVPVTVLNGDFAQPAFTAAYTGVNPYAWSVGSTAGTGTTTGVYRWNAATSGHPDGLTAASLRFPNAAHGLKQRLRGVRSGARVTVTYDESPGVINTCTAAALAEGQTYTIEGEGGPLTSGTTLPTTEKLPSNYWKPAWRTNVTYSFTANANEPLITFTSSVPNAQNASGNCGPMITNVRATQEPPPVDKTIPAGALPASEAFMGNDRRSTTADAVAYCNGAVNRCTFTAEEDYSFSYYAPARVAAETYLNCTRNTLNRIRPVSTANRSYGDLPAVAGLPGSGTGAPTNMAQQYTRGTGLSPAWSTSQERSVTEIVQPAEVSWIETQAGRRRTEGWFTATTKAADPNNDWRIHTVLDHPSTDLSDRIYQRTGPLTASEKQRCQSDRPNAPTPVGATSPAGAEG
ncbi:hypothetical protein AB0D29_13015 [Streptomyces sp. NPDC048424]|uniref:hypothetical protein n=1 Tax=Streptomyces sp. NPDC048424 TaxID=3155265 RepID=UPI0034410948